MESLLFTLTNFSESERSETICWGRVLLGCQNNWYQTGIILGIIPECMNIYARQEWIPFGMSVYQTQHYQVWLDTKYSCYQKQSNIVQCFVYSLIPVKNKYQSPLTLPVLLTTSGFLSKPPGYSLLPKWGMYQRKPPANFTFSCGLFIECTEIMLLLNTAFQ